MPDFPAERSGCGGKSSTRRRSHTDGLVFLHGNSAHSVNSVQKRREAIRGLFLDLRHFFCLPSINKFGVVKPKNMRDKSIGPCALLYSPAGDFLHSHSTLLLRYQCTCRSSWNLLTQRLTPLVCVFSWLTSSSHRHTVDTWSARWNTYSATRKRLQEVETAAAAAVVVVVGLPAARKCEATVSTSF